MLIELQTAIQMSARIDRTAIAALERAAVQQHAAAVVLGFELDPDIERVHGSGREEVSDLPGANDDLETNRLSAPNDCIDEIQRSDDRLRWTDRDRRAAHASALFADGERARQPLIATRRGAGRNRGRRPSPDHAKDVDRELTVLEKVLHRLELRLIVIHERQSGVGRGEPMRADLPVLGGRIVRRDARHVAIGTALRRRRVIERACPLTRDAGRLPVVVVVEAAEPAIAVDRNIEMHLVTARTELRCLFAVKRLEERLLVRLRIELEELVVHVLQAAAGR